MKKVAILLNKIILLMVCVFLGIIVFNIWGREKEIIQYYSRIELYGYILISMLLCVLVLMINAFLLKKEVFKYQYSWIIVGIIIFSIQCIYAVTIKMVPIWDSRNIINEAARMLTEEVPYISSVNGYFEMYGNNYCVVILLYFYYSILRALHIHCYWEATVILNILLIDSAIFIISYLLKKVKSNKVSFTFLLICLFNPYTYIYVTFVYTTTFSMAAIAIMFFLMYRLCKVNKKKKKIMYSIILGGSALLFFKLRATNFIVIIAFLITGFIYLIYNKREKKVSLKTVGLLLGIFCVSLCISNVGFHYLENRYVSTEMREKNFPITHWIMMANSNGGNGMYSEADEEYTASFSNKEDKIKANVEELKDRLQSFTWREYLIHLKEKISINWSQGINYITEIMNSNQTYGNAYRILAGENNAIFVMFYQISLSLVYLLVLVNLLKGVFSKNIDYINLNVVLILLGAMIFYLIWEVSPCYNICFIPLVMILAAEELGNSFSRQKYYFIMYPIFVGIGMMLANMDSTENIRNTYDKFSVNSIYRRPLLEQEVKNVNRESKILLQSFNVQKNKTFNRISFLVNEEQKNIDATYLFTLYDNSEEIYTQTIEPNPDLTGEYYYVIELPDKMMNGEYSFSIQSLDKEDSMKFIYTKQEIVDNNPKGFLSVNGDTQDGKLDLIFNVYEG